MRVGIDVVAVDRIARLLDSSERTAEALFTVRELSHCAGLARRAERLAARFAAKEAVLKAFGTGIVGAAALIEVEVVSEASGRPAIVLHGKTREFAERRGLRQLDVSLTHSGGFALAHAIAVWGD